jgi:hypothetical protein
MKRKISNYCFGLLVFINCFGLYQANKQNKNPFANNAINISINEKRDNRSNLTPKFYSNNYQVIKMISEN